MGLFSRITAFPHTGVLLDEYKNLKNGVKRIEVNTIWVDFFEKNSPFFTTVVGQCYHIGSISLVRIEVPYKMAWILMDKSIEINKITKETRVKCRQDYPMTLSADRMIANAVIEAMALFPDTEFFIPETINNIPVRQIVINRNKKHDKDIKDALGQVEGTKNLIAVIDAMPSDVHVTTDLLYMFPDMMIAQNYTPPKAKGNIMLGLFCGVLGMLITTFMFLYLKV